MLDHIEVREAFRERAETVVVATTGSTTISATAAGFVRSAGSFLTDGFAPAMEIVPTGFNATNNAPAVIESVTATTMTITGGRAAQAALAGRSIVTGLPLARQWENTQTPYLNAPGVRPYVSEQWVPATFTLLSFPADGGDVEESGLYILTWFGLANKGILAIRRGVRALKAKFTPGTVLLASGNAVRVWGNPGVLEGQLIPLENGYVSCQITIPWRGMSTNVIAA